MRYFLTVAEELNFRRAAARLNLSQPPLSMQIKALEEEVGVKLLERNRRKVQLTAAGEFLLGQVRETVAKFDKTVELAKLAARGEAGTLRIGFTALVPMRQSFPRTLRRFRELYPHVRQEIIHSSTEAQLEMLETGNLDVGFVRVLDLASRLDISMNPIWHDELILFAAADSKWSKGRSPVPLKALSSGAFIAFAARSESFEHVSTLCSRAGFLPRVIQRARDGGAILGFVAAGVGIAVLPSIYSKIGVSGIISRKLASPDTTSYVALVHRKQQYTVLVEQFKHIALQDAGV